jgi:hypothetical protein
MPIIRRNNPNRTLHNSGKYLLAPIVGEKYEVVSAKLSFFYAPAAPLWCSDSSRLHKSQLALPPRQFVTIFFFGLR